MTELALSDNSPSTEQNLMSVSSITFLCTEEYVFLSILNVISIINHDAIDKTDVGSGQETRHW